MLRTFEFDDYPMSGPRLIRLLDATKERFPNFKASVFCIPSAMTEKHWKPLLKRRDWIEPCPHGINHQRRECRVREIYTLRLHWLDVIAAEKRYVPLFKAPWHGLDLTFIKLLRERGMDFCCTNLTYRVPMPTPDWMCWNIKDARMRTPGTGIHCETHAIIPGRHRKHNRRHQQIDRNNFRRLRETWSEGDRWEFVSTLMRPMLKKIYLGCGPHVADDWDCLDNRTDVDPRIQRWEAPDPLPFIENRADIVLTSHLFNYLEDGWYVDFCREIYRVLRPGGVARLAEDATDSGYVWRSPGQSARQTGTIRSLPTKRKLVRALRRVGFRVRLARPGRTQSPHDVCQFDTRQMRWEKGHKYYLEGVKPDVEISV